MNKTTTPSTTIAGVSQELICPPEDMPSRGHSETHAPRLNACQGTRQMSRWRRQAQEIHKEVYVVWFILKDHKTPWFVRLVAACAVGYVFSPVQLIPSFIPIIGFLDDFLVLGTGMHLVRRLTPWDVLNDARRQAHNSFIRGNRLIQPPWVRRSIAVIACVWLLLTVGGVFLVVRILTRG